MKYIVMSLILSLSFASQADFNTVYAKKALAEYKLANKEAVKVQKAVETFLQETNQENLQKAKDIWTEARKIYSVTEIYRFYGGPIDDANGPEGLINAWPLDEAYIDYVKGKANSGIINQSEKYPEISKELLMSLNEKDGEKNISTGWHAIEFLLWGQDFNDNGPGDRPVSDFVLGQGENAQRRRAYLKAVSELLVEHLDYVVKQWEPAAKDSFYESFVDLSQEQALTNAFTSLTSMAGDELAIERIFVAYDTQFQEDEHSCFSDTTHFDLLYNFLGVKNLWETVRDNTTIKDENIALVAKIDNSLTILESELVNFKGPFDQAIFEKEGREQILKIVEGLQQVSKDFSTAASDLGVQL